MDQATENRRYVLVEQGTDRYADLKMAQAAALPVVAQALLEVIRKGIEEGHLRIQEEEGKRVVQLPVSGGQ